MPYQDIPLANDRISISQADIRGNFQELQAVLIVDHVFVGATQGKHSKVTFPMRAIGTDPVTAVGEVALYAKNNGTGVPGLFFKPENQGVGATEHDFTTAVLVDPGYCRLPCGLMMKWGSGVLAANAATVVAFDATVAFATVINAQVSACGAAGTAGAMYVQALALNQITVYNASNQGGRLFYYLVLGT